MANAKVNMHQKAAAYRNLTHHGRLFDSSGDNCLVDFERKKWESEDGGASREQPAWFEDDVSVGANQDAANAMLLQVEQHCVQARADAEAVRLVEEKQSIKKQQRAEMYNQVQAESKKNKRTLETQQDKKRQAIEARRLRILEL